ncbi:DNA alkylation repair protein [Flavobacterium branchiophilum]|uniref:DNA alkylation repair enzyme AlkD n=1 Tax=Flavobacterium branchiophilum (strain FL-15) TaxID=1034807 RepID=G2Z342_FLABF|nr:DNA alkylation repair protein [Flavobacterium branchiophilum]CCB70389.1 DNA alkylation repair enzyme AlkD [Flavobacterium branchiophilum FL-15]
MDFITHLENVFLEHKNPEQALSMEAYMKDNFKFIGIKTELRRSLQKTVFEKYQTELINNFRQIITTLFEKESREFHYCAIEIGMKYFKKNYQESDISTIAYLLTTHSWWDSVDVVAKYLLGGYLQHFPEKKFLVIENFSNSHKMWLNRSAIIFQLSYKDKTDFELLKSECEKHKTSKEFFIQKAIGWALREYSRYNPNGVLNYVADTNLKPLSKREALRNIK